jgi:hypothetical protein
MAYGFLGTVEPLSQGERSNVQQSLVEALSKVLG